MVGRSICRNVRIRMVENFNTFHKYIDLPHYNIASLPVVDVQLEDVQFGGRTMQWRNASTLTMKEVYGMPGATPEFKQQLKSAFDAIQVGQTFTFRRTFTEGDVALFCGVTGDYNPYHIDKTFIDCQYDYAYWRDDRFSRDGDGVPICRFGLHWRYDHLHRHYMRERRREAHGESYG